MAGGRSATEIVLFTGNEDKKSFAVVRDGYKESNIKVSKIGGGATRPTP